MYISEYFTKRGIDLATAVLLLGWLVKIHVAKFLPKEFNTDWTFKEYFVNIISYVFAVSIGLSINLYKSSSKNVSELFTTPIFLIYCK